MSRCSITAAEAGGANVCAFLDMLAWSEGTDKPGQPTKDRGYDVLVGGGLFTDFSRHPNILVQVRPGLASTAAGRYQLLHRYFRPYASMLRLSDFGPLAQDRIALQQIRERRALPMIQTGAIADAIAACSNICASLPGNTYGQFMHKADRLIEQFRLAGGSTS